jgi:hypothetical protein
MPTDAAALALLPRVLPQAAVTSGDAALMGRAAIVAAVAQVFPDLAAKVQVRDCHRA